MLSELDMAVYRTVHDFPGGAKALATYLSVRPGTLSNKADPACDTHHLNLSEALAIMKVSENYRILRALGVETNHGVVQLLNLTGVSDLELLDAYTRMNKELGDVAGAMNRAFEDRKLTRVEFNEITREIFEAINAQLELRRRLEAVIDE